MPAFPIKVLHACASYKFPYPIPEPSQSMDIAQPLYYFSPPCHPVSPSLSLSHFMRLYCLIKKVGQSTWQLQWCRLLLIVILAYILSTANSFLVKLESSYKILVNFVELSSRRFILHGWSYFDPKGL